MSAAGWRGTSRRSTPPTTPARPTTKPEFANWDGYALTLHFGHGAVGVCAGTYALFPEIQFEPAVDFCAARPAGAHHRQARAALHAGGVETWPNTEPLHRGVNRAFIAAVRTRRPCAHPHAAAHRAAIDGDRAGRQSLGADWRTGQRGGVSGRGECTDDNLNSAQPTVALAAIARPTFDVPLAQSVADGALAQIDASRAARWSGRRALIMDADGARRRAGRPCATPRI